MQLHFLLFLQRIFSTQYFAGNFLGTADRPVLRPKSLGGIDRLLQLETETELKLRLG